MIVSRIVTAAATVALLGATSLAHAAATPAVGEALDLATAAKARGAVQAQLAHGAHASSKKTVSGAAPGGTGAADLFANPYRAYPPSCLGDGLPFGAWTSAPVALQATVVLPGDPLAGDPGEQSYRESDTITVFRVVCTSGKSATLLEIDRPEGHSSTLYPAFPAISVEQGDNNIYIRLANDPNTLYSSMYVLTPLINSDIYVLENFYGSPVQLDFNQAFELTVDNMLAGSQQRYTTYSMPAYNPAQYPEAAQPLPISGYMTGAWYDPAHSGEGIQVEVGEQGTPGAANDRFIVLAWYTYDADGFPYWLYGAGNFTTGDRSAVVPMVYSTGGGFGGTFGSATTPDWGTIIVQFPTCNSMQFSYQSLAGLPPGVPTGASSKTWSRISQINGLTCE